VVSTCANPHCSTPFLYLRSGRLFIFPPDRPGLFRIESYWLCDNCADQFTLSRDIENGGVHLLEYSEGDSSIGGSMPPRANKLRSGYA
jgi:hypothetical protein